MSVNTAKALWDYYTAAAEELGQKPGSSDGVQQGYSVRWYFAEHSPEKNILTRAFLGERYALALVRRAILGQASPAELNELYDGRGSAEYDENDFLEGDPQPDVAQKEAIRAALAMPISFIKGPPGTGKTSGILHLLSCINRQGKTAAMVSSNNMAIEAITDKLDTYEGSSAPKQADLYKRFARLGNTFRREEFAAAHPKMFGKKRMTSANVRSKDFFLSWPIIASTIHSLPKCFADWYAAPAGSRREPVYDYVIVDESSQVNALLGLMAMGGARHLVLVGDDDQLPPVTDEDRIRKGTVKEEARAAAIIPRTFEDIYALREDRSFLRACMDVFLGGSQALEAQCSKMLYRHYRCHPGIIGFCQQEVYSGGRTPLEIHTRNYDRSVRTPIRVVWFEGEFCEKVQRQEKDARTGRARIRKSKCNRRQTEIFMQEEWPDLLDRLCADPCSVLDLDREGRRSFRFGVLSPFRGQLWDLRDRLSLWIKDEDNKRLVREKAAAHRKEILALLEEVGVETYLRSHKALAEEVRRTHTGSLAETIVELCIQSFPRRLRPLIQGERDKENPMEVTLPELTVHKAQGQEYDVVYFLPVDDALWEWPWSRKKRLINVAVSRAKRELRLIVSTALMDKGIQRALVGKDRVVTPQRLPQGFDPEEEDFIRKLISYVWDNGPGGPGPWTDGCFGFHRARSRSLFDRGASVSGRRDLNSRYPSAPEICLQDWLSRLPLAVNRGLSLYINAPIAAISPPPSLPKDMPDREDLEKYIENGAHFDCLVCRGERILMAIEVDGEHHRRCRTNRERDAKKNAIVARGFGAAMYTTAKDGFVPMEGNAPDGGGFTFLRLPADGTTWNEEQAILTLLARRLRDESGPVYTLPVRTLADLPANRRWYVFRVLSWAQDWNTGRPVQEKKRGVDTRWVPRQIGTCRGLMMAYLPDKRAYWKKAQRLRPSMVCRADAWERLSVKADQRKKE